MVYAKRQTTLAVLLVISTVFIGMLSIQAKAESKSFQSSQPVARLEYWQMRQASIENTLSSSTNLSAYKIVFIGDSITDFWLLDDDPWVKGQKHGRQIWDESFSGTDPQNLALNLGISGDRTEHILFRILPKSKGGLGELDSPSLNPDYIVIMAGINNSWAVEDPAVDSISDGVEALVATVHARKPSSRVILLSLLPTNDPDKNNNVVKPVNQRLLDMSLTAPFSSYVSYLNLYTDYVDGSGMQISRYFNEGLHPSPAGYRIWRDRLVPFLQDDRKAHPR